ncbi:MAG TPA: exodeoxyribonuclease VII large subunit [Desulfatiglandales bacterium]|nr:exodeoxyribonuclease VII large subunit [Desulfatiglandales bacterium]
MDIPFQPPRIYTVSDLTAEIKYLLEEAFPFVWIEGEISNFSSPSSMHYYMSLKDEYSQIRAVMFRMQAHYLKFKPEDGMKVIARGRIGVYEPRGEYQIILDYLEPLGVGALAAGFEQAKKKLSLEGVFDDAKKRPIPFLPTKIAVITSPTGAAIRDFLRISDRRMPNLDITIVPVRVQGDEAAGDIVEALDIVNRELAVDVIVLTRGGGSMEDLWPFNQEEVAYAIRRSLIPVVSAVGHEVDLTISDLAADLRAPTPSGAAELVVREKEILYREIKGLSSRLGLTMQSTMNRIRDKIRYLSSRIKDPRRNLADIWLRLDELYDRLLKRGKESVMDNFKRLKAVNDTLISNSPSHYITMASRELIFYKRSFNRALKSFLDKKKMDIRSMSDRLDSLSPFSILERGYSIARKLPEMNILKDYTQVNTGDKVNIILARGTVNCLVEKAEQEE